MGNQKDSQNSIGNEDGLERKSGGKSKTGKDLRFAEAENSRGKENEEKEKKKKQRQREKRGDTSADLDKIPLMGYKNGDKATGNEAADDLEKDERNDFEGMEAFAP